MCACVCLTSTIGVVFQVLERSVEERPFRVQQTRQLDLPRDAGTVLTARIAASRALLSHIHFACRAVGSTGGVWAAAVVVIPQVLAILFVGPCTCVYFRSRVRV